MFTAARHVLIFCFKRMYWVLAGGVVVLGGIIWFLSGQNETDNKKSKTIKLYHYTDEQVRIP